MKETKKKSAIVLVDETYLKDFDGGDATLVPPDDIKAKVQHMASSSLPTLLSRAIEIVKNSDNDRVAIEAMKFIKTLADGEVKAKQIDAVAKKFTDAELMNALDGQFEDVE